MFRITVRYLKFTFVLRSKKLLFNYINSITLLFSDQRSYYIITLIQLCFCFQIKEAPPKLLEARQHGKTVLECSAAGSPAPRITW
jgi:hypothetical protein